MNTNQNIERKGLLLPTQTWVPVHEILNHDTGSITTTEVLELPAGCLVRTTVVQVNDGRLLNGTNTVAVALVFVPNTQLSRREDMVEFRTRS